MISVENRKFFQLSALEFCNGGRALKLDPYYMVENVWRYVHSFR